MALLIPETKVGIVAPGSPGNVVLVEYGQHVACPVVSQLAVHWLVNTPLTAEQLQVVLLGGLDGILKLGTDGVDIPYLLGVRLQLILNLSRSSLVILLRYQHTRIVHLALILAQWCPPSTIVCQNHGVVVVETQDDILVALGHLQVLHGLVSLPHVTTNHQCTLWLQFAQGLVYLGYQLVPLLVLGCYRLVHKLVSHPVVAAVLQGVRQLLP